MILCQIRKRVADVDPLVAVGVLKRSAPARGIAHVVVLAEIVADAWIRVI
jgi:hypothetical protein